MHIKNDEGRWISSETVADGFAGIIRDWLSEEEFEELCRRNREDSQEEVCHSHDFCDANDAMLSALDREGISTDMTNSIVVNFVNAAWAEAKQEYLS